MILSILLAASVLPLTFAGSLPKKSQGGPVVRLPYVTAVGSSANNVESFIGIPFAQPPVGQLRLKPPQPINTRLGTIQATGVPLACPQQGSLTIPDIPGVPIGPGNQTLPAGEDCLTLNVQRPCSANRHSRLPVIFWIYGGAFEQGATQQYDATQLINSSVVQGKEFIYVAANYRLGAFGFLPGSKVLVDGSSNLGLLDQRLALQWVADNIASFGGDPSQVTIWGQSAGSMSVMHQMALYKGDNRYKGRALFRGAIMDSGGITPADPVDCPRAEAVYDQVVKAAGCANAADSLACLRSINYTTFYNAATTLPGLGTNSAVALSYRPRPDGLVLTESTDVLVKKGQYAKVPFIIGDQEDEGTLISLIQTNITTTDQLIDYSHTFMFRDATRTQVANFINLYPDNPAAGSPFRTGDLNNLYPQYKRIAAISGDVAFSLQRRNLLQFASAVNPHTPTWSYLATYYYGTPILGTYHSSDIPVVYGLLGGELPIPTSTIQSFYLSFVKYLDPNVGVEGLPNWPQWTDGNKLMNFSATANTLIPDTFRLAASNYLAAQAPSFNL
ncbi:Carboxylic ester hydrolase [Venustampulla echinocandica]|uniref:Carboxylic ester hydrolase n=1 Tax=Venustampulla echinocandica TaxID=2656787 RepID=A0A370TF38_9HELO|nr:Carboxylic ester hydrolase [Venustampulla echinocandica]RDL33270.1 Carboxylic ester hydrolase [Venustampulla echinocandica]